MTMKTKRNVAIGAGTTLCAALALLIALRFTPDSEQPIIPNTSEPETSSSSTENVEIPTANDKKPESSELADNTVSDNKESSQPEIDFDDFIENGGTEVVQNFSEPDTEQKTPPEPPKIEDEAALTNPDKEPTYEPEQTKPQQSTTQTPADTPKHGDTKDGMIYIEGFGWIKDEGGGGRGEDASDMYENGNKVGSFG